MRRLKESASFTDSPDRLSYIARKLTDVYIFDFDFVDVEDDADDDEEYDSPYSSSTENDLQGRRDWIS